MNQRGSVLMGVLMIIGFSLLVGVPVLQAAQVENKAAINDQMDAQAFYLAEAGIQHVKVEALKELQRLVGEGWMPADGIASPFATVSRDNYGPGDYDASAYLIDNGDGTFGIRLESNGIVGGTTGLAKGTRITFPLLTDGSGGSGGSGGTGGGGSAPPLDMALFAGDGFRMQGSPLIVGNAVTNATGSDTVDLDWSCSLQGDLTIGPGASASTVIDLPNNRFLGDAMTGTVKNLTAKRVYPDPQMPSFPNLPTKPSMDADWWPSPPHFITEDGYYPSIDVKSELRIEVGSGERVIRTNSLKIHGSGKLVIVGSGKLSLYIDNTFDISGSGTLNASGSPDKVSIFYNGTKDFNLSGAGAFNGSIQAATADVKITGSGRMAGHIVTGGDEVDLSGDGAAGVTLVYAPQADVNISGSAKVTGAVICKYAKLTGTGSIRYDSGVSGFYNGLTGGGGASIDFGDQIWAPTR